MRTYDPADEPSWLRCRVLGFLDTAYFDDVWPVKPPSAGLDLVAATAGTVAGILTATVNREAATIDTVVVHPDFRRQGGLCSTRRSRCCARTASQSSMPGPGTIGAR